MNVLDNPYLLAMVLSALVSLFHEIIEPRFPALAKLTALIKSLGIDLPTAYRAVRAFFPKLPTLPAMVIMVGTWLSACSIGGCTDAIAVKAAAGVANAAGDLTNAAAPVLQEKCTVGMQKAQTVADAKKLADSCDPAELAFDGVRSAHVELRGELVSAQANGGVTVGDILKTVRALTAACADLVKKIGALK